MLLLVTLRSGEPASAEGARAGSPTGCGAAQRALQIELGPLAPDDLAALLGGRPRDTTEAIAARSEGNPFFAQELLGRGRRGG